MRERERESARKQITPILREVYTKRESAQVEMEVWEREREKKKNKTKMREVETKESAQMEVREQ